MKQILRFGRLLVQVLSTGHLQLTRISGQKRGQKVEKRQIHKIARGRLNIIVTATTKFYALCVTRSANSRMTRFDRTTL